MSNIEEKLVILVSKYKELYDMGNSNYSNQGVKDNCWLEIAEEINLTVTACKQKWKSLRDCFRKAIKARKSKSGDSARKIRPWKLEKQMAFLLPFIDERQQISNLQASSGDEVEDDTQDDVTQDDDTQGDELETDSIVNLTPTPSPSPSASTSSRSKRTLVNNPRRNSKDSVADVLNKYLNKKNESKCTPNQDSLTSFFLSMADTVRSLPAHLQIEVKSKVFQVVNKAELAALAPAEQPNYLSTQLYHHPPTYTPDYPFPHSQPYQLPMHPSNNNPSFDPNSNPNNCNLSPL